MKRKLSKALSKAQEARKPKLIYECFDYIIEEIPLNYRATIKCAVNPKFAKRGIDRECYSHPEHGLQHSKYLAEQHISEWFLSGVVPEQPFSLKSS